MQGHNEKECFLLHPKLYPKDDEKINKEGEEIMEAKDKEVSVDMEKKEQAEKRKEKRLVFRNKETGLVQEREDINIKEE